MTLYKGNSDQTQGATQHFPILENRYDKSKPKTLSEVYVTPNLLKLEYRLHEAKQ